MNLLQILNSLIVEDRIRMGSFTDGNEKFNVNATDHTQIANTLNSSKARPDFEDLANVVFEFNDVIADVSKSIISNPFKDSILVRDNWNGFDFIIYPHNDEDGINLNIATSIKHPEKLNFKKQNKLVIITSDGDTIIKEELENNNFTKVIKGNTIIYII
jgi:hypothetical protein